MLFGLLGEKSFGFFGVLGFFVVVWGLVWCVELVFVVGEDDFYLVVLCLFLVGGVVGDWEGFVVVDYLYVCGIYVEIGEYVGYCLGVFV